MNYLREENKRDTKHLVSPHKIKGASDLMIENKLMCRKIPFSAAQLATMH